MLNNSNSIEQTNEILKENGLPSYEDAFSYSFRISKKHFFFVRFGQNESHRQQPYFATSGGVLNHTRSDYSSSGQNQIEVAPRGSIARIFFDKWNKLHTKPLTHEQLTELHADLEKLKDRYDWIDSDRFSKVVSIDREVSNRKKVD